MSSNISYNIKNLINLHKIDRKKLLEVRKIPDKVLDLLDNSCGCPCAGDCKGFCINSVADHIHPINYVSKECFFNLFHLHGKVSKISGICSGRNSSFYLVLRYNKPYVVEILPDNVLHLNFKNYKYNHTRIYDVCLVKGTI